MKRRVSLVVVMVLALAGVVSADDFPVDLSGSQITAQAVPVEMRLQAYHRFPGSWPCDGLQGEDMEACIGQVCLGSVTGDEASMVVTLDGCPGFNRPEEFTWHEEGRFYGREISSDHLHLNLETWTIHQNLIVRRNVWLVWDGHIPRVWLIDLTRMETVHHLIPVFPKDAESKSLTP